jgi:RNA polymerase sigma factor (sigma-70 family)
VGPVTLPPFEEVVRAHGPTVWRVCRALLGPVEADDAWSETFLAALRAYPDLRPDSNVEAWLVTIAHRKAIDQHRVRARTPVPVPELPESPEPETTVDSELWDAVRALPFTQRAAVTYHHLAGMRYAQIAGILGHSEAAARRAAADGIKTLRARLARTVEGVPR